MIEKNHENYIKERYSLWLNAFVHTVLRVSAGRLHSSKKRRHTVIALRTTNPLETPFFAYLFATLQICGKGLQGGWSYASAKRRLHDDCVRALPPPEKVVRWGSLAALGLAFFRRLPRVHSCWTHFTTIKKKRQLAL